MTPNIAKNGYCSNCNKRYYNVLRSVKKKASKAKSRSLFSFLKSVVSNPLIQTKQRALDLHFRLHYLLQVSIFRVT